MHELNKKKQWQVPKLILFEADQILTGASPSFGFERIQYCQGGVLMTHTEAGFSTTFMGLDADGVGDAALGATPNAVGAVSGMCV